MPIPGFNDVKVPYELQQVLSGVDQNLKVNFSIGASYKEILESQEPILQTLAKGFSMSIKS